MNDAIHQRRSERDYAPTPLSCEVLERLVDAAIQAPSAMNEQPWHFTIIGIHTLVDLISCESKSHMLTASKSVRNVDRYKTPSHRRGFLPANLRWAVEDCALAAQNFMLAAHAANLGTCWIGFAQSWLGTKEGKEAMGLPDSFLPVAPIIVGYPKSAAACVPRNGPHIHS